MKKGDKIFIPSRQSYAEITELDGQTPTKAKLPTGEIIALIGIAYELISLIDKLILVVESWIDRWKAKRAAKSKQKD